ncbi:hypothetical protein [Schaalia sp. lx-100]|uniref:hypothetical protein n=1 Tax=Schaalia sp. lx-100 TaxID=2899081 RepID=UPI001E57CE2C|nr:hypothetical protein [Schaalia sp. lx-100]MCD4557630.1 hypothetical protein [Schaalia sp. lx-100]
MCNRKISARLLSSERYQGLSALAQVALIEILKHVDAWGVGDAGTLTEHLLSEAREGDEVREHVALALAELKLAGFVITYMADSAKIIHVVDFYNWVSTEALDCACSQGSDEGLLRNGNFGEERSNKVIQDSNKCAFVTSNTNKLLPLTHSGINICDGYYTDVTSNTNKLLPLTHSGLCKTACGNVESGSSKKEGKDPLRKEKEEEEKKVIQRKEEEEKETHTPKRKKSPSNRPQIPEQTSAPNDEKNTPQPTPEPESEPFALIALTDTRDHSASRIEKDFERFWKAYPRKVGKLRARVAWDKAIKEASPEVIIQGAARYAADPNREAQYTKHPTTWLNAGSWEDEPLPARRTGSTDEIVADWLALAEHYQQQDQAAPGNEWAHLDASPCGDAS